MNRALGRCAAALAATAALTGIGVAAGAGSAFADAPTNGRYCAIRDNAAVRTEPGGPARDNLALGQQFEVQSHAGETYVYGYKVANSVHGWVLNDSLGSC